MRRLIVWLLVLLLPLAGTAEGMFSEGEPHKSHLDYRQYFDTLSAQIGECTLSIAKDAYSEEIAAQLYTQITSDETALAALAPLSPHTVYVVKKPLAGMQRIDNAIYCTAAQVLDGSYRPWLAEVALGVVRWQASGIAGYTFGVEVDSDALRSWYADDANDDMLSLFPAYFVEAFATHEELHMAEQTATALFGYIVEQVSLDAALTAEPSAYVQAWLDSIEVERAYSDPYAGLLDGYTWTHNQFYALIGTSSKGDVFKLNPLVCDMTPCVVERISRYMDSWKVEAIAEYLTHAYYNGQVEQETIFTYMQDSYITAHEDPEMRAFYTQVKEIYQEYASLPENFRAVKLGLWWRAAVQAKTEQGKQLNSVSGVYAGAGSASLDAVNGNELSYTESEWLASYLINRHGLSAFLHYCMDEGVSFEDAFGVPYETAKAEWLANRTLTD